MQIREEEWKALAVENILQSELLDSTKPGWFLEFLKSHKRQMATLRTIFGRAQANPEHLTSDN